MIPFRCTLWILAAAIIVAGAASGAQFSTTRDSAERPDLLPRHERWHRFPQVESVCFDRQHRAWFTFAKAASVDEIKRQVERSRSLAAPWVEGARVLLFDSAGRIWISPRGSLLLAYDPEAGEWIERPAIGAIGPDDLLLHHREHYFTSSMAEDSDGRIFAADGCGCHVYDHGTWSYQLFNSALGAGSPQSQLLGDWMSVIGLAQDDHGRVYAWNRSVYTTGFAGCQVHDRNGWRRIVENVGAPRGRIAAIVPLRGGRILVCPRGTPAFITGAGGDSGDEAKWIRDEIALLGHEAFAKREAAQWRLISYGAVALPALKAASAESPSPEVRIRAARCIKAIEQAGAKPLVDGRELVVTRVLDQGGVGDAYLWAGPGADPAKPREPTVWRIDADGRLAPAPSLLVQGIPTWGPVANSGGRLLIASDLLLLAKDGKQVPLTDGSDGPIVDLFGIGKDGRIFFRTWLGVIGLDPAAPDARPGLPATSETIRPGRQACLTADGHLVAKLGGPNHGFLSLFEHGRWTELPAPEGQPDVGYFTSIQPLRDGGLIARQELNRKVLLWERGRWSVFDDTRALVEGKSDFLVKQIDNSMGDSGDEARIRVDARQALWCPATNQLSVWDNGHWLPEPDVRSASPIRDCLPVFGRRLMLVSDRQKRAFLVRIEAGALKFSPYPAASNFPFNVYPNIRVVSMDSAGRCFFPQRNEDVLLFEGAGMQRLHAIGLPCLEDSAHRIWFTDATRHVLTMLESNRIRVQFKDESISNESTVVEDKDHTYWTNTTRGLLHLKFRADGGIETFGPAYSRGIPAVGVRGMWIDAERNLWMSTGGRLYRVQLPEADR
jgi:hypothetical protein